MTQFLLDRSGLSALQSRRLSKCLRKKYRFDGCVLSLGQWLRLNAGRITHKKATICTRARKKRQGCYAKIGPKTEHSVWTGDTGIDIPKTVYDCLNVEIA